MPSKERKGMVGKYIELPAEQVARLEAFAEGRGETFSHHVRMAIDRHLAYPPPVAEPPPKPPVPPLPDGRKGKKKA